MLTFLKSAARLPRRLSSEYYRSAAVVSFNHDGMEIARVRQNRRWLPLWHIAVFLYLALLIRLITMTDIGPVAYQERMEEMKNGTLMERAAARVMYMDPWSRSLAIGVRRGLKELGML